MKNQQEQSVKQEEIDILERQVVSDVLEAFIDHRESGCNVAHDSSYPDGYMSRCAAAYALYLVIPLSDGDVKLDVSNVWPRPYDGSFNPKERRKNLTRAAAFLLAEIVRLDADVQRTIAFGSKVEGKP